MANSIRTTSTATPSEPKNRLHELYFALDNAFSYQINALKLAYDLLGETNDPFFDEIILTLESSDNTNVLNALYNDVCEKIKEGE